MLDENLFNIIDTSEMKEDIFSLDELVNSIKDQLEENPILLSGTSSKGTFGDFDSNLWAIRTSLTESNIYFDFNNIVSLKFKGVSNNDIVLLKCWLIESILDSKFNDKDNIEYRNLPTFQFRLKVICKLMDASNNFSLDFLDKKKGSRLDQFINKDISSSIRDRVKFDAICGILDYIEYVEGKVSAKYMNDLLQYMKELSVMLTNYNIKTNARKLPKTKDILLFGEYVDMFFHNEDIPKEFKLFYMPILIWWKLTTIIPMRPSEFARKIKRNYLLNENGTYYLKIDRVKKTADVKNYLLPVLNRIQIPDTMYNLINNYVLETNSYGETETLISYNALCAIRNKIKELYPNYYNKKWNTFLVERKINRNVFTRNILYNLLDSFYDFVINTFYKDSLIEERIRLGDTRHIAFTSLMLQGYSPVEIAILGGHRTLRTLDNYTCTLNTYVDTEVISIIRKNIKISTFENQTIMDIVFNMPSEPPISLSKCIHADIDGEDLGYCTNQFESNNNPCEHDDCYYCSKWWCEPIEHNFLILEQIVKKKLLKKDNKLKRDLDFIISLLKDVGFDIYDGNLVINKSIADTLKRASLNLESSTKEVIHLKYQLINHCEDSFKLLSDIEDLLPTRSVDDYIKERSLNTQKIWEDKIWQDLK